MTFYPAPRHITELSVDERQQLNEISPDARRKYDTYRRVYGQRASFDLAANPRNYPRVVQKCTLLPHPDDPGICRATPGYDGAHRCLRPEGHDGAHHCAWCGVVFVEKDPYHVARFTGGEP